MTIREFLSLWIDDVTIEVYMIKKPIIDNFHDLEHCMTANVDVMINCNKDFLDYTVENLQMNNDLIIVVCKEHVTK